MIRSNINFQTWLASLVIGTVTHSFPDKILKIEQIWRRKSKSKRSSKKWYQRFLHTQNAEINFLLRNLRRKRSIITDIKEWWKVFIASKMGKIFKCIKSLQLLDELTDDAWSGLKGDAVAMHLQRKAPYLFDFTTK